MTSGQTMGPTRGGVVCGLAATAVKGLRVTPRAQLALGRGGVSDNRLFYLIDERGRLINGKLAGELAAVVADYDERERRLTLTFPDGTLVSSTVAVDGAVETSWSSLVVRGRVLVGPWAQALSEHAGMSLRVVQAADEHGAVDRGRLGAVTMISRGSLAELSRIAEQQVDVRRFRMLMEIDGTAPHGEDAWVGRRVRIGAAVVAVHGHVGRCLVTSQHPERGDVDLPTLDLLRTYRIGVGTTEPLALGIFGEVLEPGTVRVGDPVTPLED